MTIQTRSNFQAHPFHLVSPSPWPIYTCMSLLSLTTSGVLTMHGFSNAGFSLATAFVCVVLSMSFWWRDVISEGPQWWTIPLINKLASDLLISLYPPIVLAGKSTATSEEIEAKQKELQKQLKELAENKAERKVVDEENSRHGDTDSPNESKSAEELSQWDELIKHTQETIVELINWLNR